MRGYLSVNRNASSVAVAICARCGFKRQYAELRQDPNNQLWVCAACEDLKDPYDLPARKVESISLQHPRSDEELV